MSRLFEKLLRPVLFRLDAEKVHELALKIIETGLASHTARAIASRKYATRFPGRIERFGLEFSGPVGIAAGFDKNARVVDQLASLGFGFVEVGTITFRPQVGNEKPRMFRLPLDSALINRLGFNNDGAAAVVARLSKAERKCVVGVNIGRNKDVPNEEAVENYIAAFEFVHPVADYIAVNVSSPNTPNLRDLQRAESMDQLLTAMQARNNELGPRPLLVKIAPDLTDQEIESAVDICRDRGIAGIIATNTTVSRDGLRTADVGRFGAGGLSGKPLSVRSTEVVRKIFRYSNGEMPVIGVGGIMNAGDAFEKILAGACLVQAYTGFIYAGPSFASNINRGLIELLERRGFGTLDDAVGAEAS